MEILSSGKSLIPYEKITKMDSLDKNPENQFFFLKSLNFAEN